jgi:LacI family transcriptional regulator, gluconate utilization system Gnt-I transcriptional repressor
MPEPNARTVNAAQRIKMTDVAKAAGVSAMTVSRALKHDGRIAPATRRHILAVVHELGYVPDRMAGSFSSQRSGIVALLVPSLNNPHFADTASGLQEVLRPAGLQVILGYTNYRKETAETLIQAMLERRPEAIVLTYDDHSPRARQLLVSSGIPVIEIWETPKRPIGHVVGFSNRQAAAAMTQHLIAIGRRHIGYIGEAADEGTRGAERRKGFTDALKAAGLDHKRQIAIAAPPVSMLQGREAMHQIMRRWPDTDAVMCVSDPAAYGALSACQLSGIAVPGRVAIAGFGDFEISRCSVPGISTVAVNGLDIGMETGAMVLGLLHDKTAPAAIAAVTCMVDALPVVRGSTLAPSPGSPGVNADPPAVAARSST